MNRSKGQSIKLTDFLKDSGNIQTNAVNSTAKPRMSLREKRAQSTAKKGSRLPAGKAKENSAEQLFNITSKLSGKSTWKPLDPARSCMFKTQDGDCERKVIKFRPKKIRPKLATNDN